MHVRFKIYKFIILLLALYSLKIAFSYLAGRRLKARGIEASSTLFVTQVRQTESHNAGRGVLTALLMKIHLPQVLYRVKW